MSRNFLNQDFGSDEEDEDFNPAPANDSDNEDVDAKVSIRDLVAKEGRC